MDEDYIRKIEELGYNPTHMLAVLAGIQSGLIFKAKDSPNKVILRAPSKKNKNKNKDKGKTRLYMSNGKTCKCVSCGTKINGNMCPYCGHDNYEIMAIKGEPSR